MFQVDFREVFIRLVKYLVEGVAVALAAYYIPKKNTNSTEIFIIAIEFLMSSIIPPEENETRTL